VVLAVVLLTRVAFGSAAPARTSMRGVGCRVKCAKALGTD
jgi:hypothetical protein